MKDKKKRAVEIISEIFENTEMSDFNEYELVDVEFVKEGKDRFLRLYIDKEGGVSHEDCSFVSRKISEILDSKDPIKDAYFLEVSSPGIERPLKKISDFTKFAGKRAEIKLYAPINGLKCFEGHIDSVVDDKIYIRLDESVEPVTIPYDKIASSRLVFSFDD